MRDMIADLHNELRKIAARRMAREKPDHTMQPTDLVHEAFFRLTRQENLQDASREALLAAAAVTMHRLLIDYARSTRYRKSLEHKGDPGPAVSEVRDKNAANPLDILSLEEAMQKLAAHHPRRAKIVECRIFAGMTNKEIASAMGVSVGTIGNEWAVAKRWLQQEFRSGRMGPGDERPARRSESL
jgi:RNA polymerase sigma-70 factor, ECF subfamily